MITTADPTENLSVLIADDDPLISDYTARQLARLGYPVAGRAYDGPAAVELASQLHPSVVLMDLRMIDPDTGQDDPHAGFKAARAISDHCSVPVVMLTAHGTPRLTQEATEAGVSAYLVKPACDSDLDRAIMIAQARFHDLVELRRLTAVLQQQNAELLAAQAGGRTLAGLIPICANCKKTRDEHGQWEAVELYIQERCEARFTHTVCPECCVKLYPDIAADVLAACGEKVPDMPDAVPIKQVKPPGRDN